MDVKIIKRSDREQTAAKALEAESKPNNYATPRVTALVVNSWIKELRQKRKTEAELSRTLFNEQPTKLFA